MRVLVVGHARCLLGALAEAVPGAVTISEATFPGAMAALEKRPDLIITSDRIGETGDTGSGLDLARSARARRVPCVLVSDVWGDGAYGAVGLHWEGALVDALVAAGIRPCVSR
jgi:hypothetical protein